MKKLIPLFLVVAVAGCGIFAKNRLEKGGPYSGYAFAYSTNATGQVTTNIVLVSASNYPFFAVDSSFELSWSVVNAAFTFERNNRKLLWEVSPNIKHTLDKLRPQAWSVWKSYAAARTVYKANPIPANLTAMQQILAQMQAIAASAQAAISTYQGK